MNYNQIHLISKMRITVLAGADKFRIPCEPYQTVSWLIREIIKRYDDLHNKQAINNGGNKIHRNHHSKQPLSISHLRTLNENIILYSEDQLIEVCRQDEILVAVRQSAHESLDPQTGDMLTSEYYLMEVIGEGATGRVFKAKDVSLTIET